MEEKGWEWRLSKFPLSAYCRISGHADLVYIDQPKALFASKDYQSLSDIPVKWRAGQRKKNEE